MAPRPNWKGYLKLSLVSCSGKSVSKVTPKAAAPQTGNVIDLLKRSLELEGKRGKEKKTKAPSLVPAMPKGKAKSKARA